LSITEVQKAFPRVLAHGAKASQRFLSLFGFGLAFHQTEFRSWFCPTTHLRLGKATEPAFILVEQ
jgi:hypothetical protein